MSANTPVYELKVGRVKATIWANGSNAEPWYTVGFVRLYKHDETWKTTPSFKRDDLAALAEAATSAQEWIDGAEGDGAGCPRPAGAEDGKAVTG